jgi:hypothetical protein
MGVTNTPPPSLTGDGRVHDEGVKVLAHGKSADAVLEPERAAAADGGEVERLAVVERGLRGGVCNVAGLGRQDGLPHRIKHGG